MKDLKKEIGKKLKSTMTRIENIHKQIFAMMNLELTIRHQPELRMVRRQLYPN